MDEKEELQASIIVQDGEEEEEEEIYSQHLNTQSASQATKDRAMVEQTQSQQHSQEHSKSKNTYAMRLKEAKLMPLTKRLQRNQIYLMRAVIAGETYLPQIKLQESNSQRIGPKIEIRRIEHHSKLAVRHLKSSYIVSAANAFNSLSADIRKNYKNKESFKLKLERFLADIDVIEDNKALQRNSLFAQLKSYNSRYHSSFAT